MPVQVNDKTMVRVSSSQMEAYLWLAIPGPGETYTIDQLKAVLAANGIRAGIMEEKLYKILDENIYGKEILVACGKEPIDGIDGYFDFKFNRRPDKHPKLLPDGSVDYWSVNLIEQVHAGQVIARYVPAIPGTPGYTVKGMPKIGKRGRELPPLKGKGFDRSEDNLVYTSLIDGKIDMNSDRIIILPTYEITGDADLATGNIDFKGDVIIHGVVHSGVSVRASGNITIDGIVEAAVLESDKDIILRSGMMGAQKAEVHAKGSIMAKFFEYTAITAGGRIEADVLIQCQVECGDRIVLNGKHGGIIGGAVSAVNGVEAAELGNDAEIQTDICVGVGNEILSRANLLVKKLEATRENVERTEDALQDFEILGKERGVSYKDDPRRLQLLRSKIHDLAVLAQDQMELEKLQETIEKARDANVMVHGKIYPGVMVKINDSRILVKDYQDNVVYMIKSGRIMMNSLNEGIRA